MKCLCFKIEVREGHRKKIIGTCPIIFILLFLNPGDCPHILGQPVCFYI